MPKSCIAPTRRLMLALVTLPVIAAAQTSLPADTPPRPGTEPSRSALKASDTVLIRNQFTTLTRGDYDLELTKLPPDARGGFGGDPKRVNALLNKILIGKSFAAKARLAGLDKTPEAQQRINAEVERLLATIYMERFDAETAREFDARPGMEAAARERWLADADNYRTPEQADVTQIVFETTKRGKEEALRLAESARAQIIAGADISALARESSDDPTAKRTGGRLKGVVRDQPMDPAVNQAIFALKAPGDVSQPVLTRAGYHVIRLDAKRPAAVKPFAEVKAQIIDSMRAQYVDQRRGELINTIRTDPSIVVNEEAVEALVIRISDEAFRKPLEKYTEPSVVTPAPK